MYCSTSLYLSRRRPLFILISQKSLQKKRFALRDGGRETYAYPEVLENSNYMKIIQTLQGGWDMSVALQGNFVKK